MDDAFRRALDAVKRRGASPHVDRLSLDLVEEMLAAPEGPPAPVSPAQLAKLIYGARRLGRGWTSYAQPGQESPTRLAQLQSRWVLLAAALLHLPTDQMIAVLSALAQELNASKPRPEEQRRRYLTRQLAQQPARLSGLSAIPWLGARPGTAYLLHALEELAAVPLEERAAFHSALAQDEPGGSETEPHWLLERVGTWLAERQGGHVE
jgi:hypothetical protein